jgi:uncharacterized protein (TIGR02145 family)
MRLLITFFASLISLAIYGQCLDIDACNYGNDATPPINIGLNQSYTASSTYAYDFPDKAFDNNMTTPWNAGDYPTQWIACNFNTTHSIDSITFWYDNSPPSMTTQEIHTTIDGENWVLHQTFNEYHNCSGSSNCILLEAHYTKVFSPAIEDILGVKIVTTQNPSWVGWFELEIWEGAGQECDYTCCPGPGCCDEGTYWNEDSQTCIITNPTDSNLDGCTDLNDLMNLLASYGDCGLAGFTTCGDDIEYEGYSYSTVQIGDQCWFAENCRYIPEVSPSNEGNTTDPYYYVYGYEGTDVTSAQATSSFATYGVLYNWPAVMTEGLCPSGWHIPSDGEWQTLEISLGMSESEAAQTGWRGSPVGDYMKSTSGWNSGGNGSNSSGFTGFPGGFRYSVGFLGNGYDGIWWSASESGSDSWERLLYYVNDDVYRDFNDRSSGFSARCVRD